ncbi:MAG TPA: hypothetical protein V6C95_01295 [Coleofasciculaceae cyanobacterium]
MHPTNDPSCQKTNQTPAVRTSSRLPIDLLKSGQLLALKPNCQGGLIIQKPFYADFVGPGSAVGSSFDVTCTSVYAIGQVEFYAPTSYAERQQAFQTRMAYSQALTKILLEDSPLHRAFCIINQLSHWLGADKTQKIPPELIAHLAGLLPKTVAIALQHYPAKNSSQVLTER